MLQINFMKEGRSCGCPPLFYFINDYIWIISSFGLRKLRFEIIHINSKEMMNYMMNNKEFADKEVVNNESIVV